MMFFREPLPLHRILREAVRTFEVQVARAQPAPPSGAEIGWNGVQKFVEFRVLREQREGLSLKEFTERLVAPAVAMLANSLGGLFPMDAGPLLNHPPAPECAFDGPLRAQVRRYREPTGEDYWEMRFDCRLGVLMKEQVHA